MKHALLALLLVSTPAAAGDVAERAVIGFSEDGGVFAFEEYGVQDGSGFPYSNIYIIDTARDSWLPGSPVRVRIEGDLPPLHEARSEAMDGAQPVFRAAGLWPGDRPGVTLGSSPVTEVSADPHRMEVLPRAVLLPLEEPISLQIREVGLPASDCFDGEADGVGFELFMQWSAQTRVLHEDGSRVPASRGCASGYRIGDVILYEPPAGPRVVVVLIAYTRPGFEGPDVRWLAVAARL